MSGYPEWSEGGGHRQLPMPPMPPMPPPMGHHHHHHAAGPKKTSWLLPDYNGGGNQRGGPPPLPMPPPMPPFGGVPHGGFGGHGRGFPPQPPHMRKPHNRGAASQVSFDTSGKDPDSIRARIFIGSLNGQYEVVSREDVIELCLPYGSLRGVTFFKKQGYAFVQFEQAGDADACCRELNGVRWKGCVMDVHPVDAPTRPAGGGERKGPGALAVKAVPTTNYDEISYDTSQKDPALMRARVFIGSLTARSARPVVRNDIIELFLPFGRITAVTLFKGYAFVQFESAVDAVEACDKLNGKPWRGNTIDVHLAMEGANRKRNPDDMATEPTGETSMDWTTGSAAKRAREAEEPKSGVELICKTCRGSFAEPAEFVAHRESGACAALTRTGEPPSLGCDSCEAVMPNAWRLLFHLMDSHQKKLVTVDASEASLSKAKELDDTKREEWWASVEKWMEEAQPKTEETEEEEIDDKKDIAITEVTIVCGSCKLVTEDWSLYKEHKKKDCIKPRDQLEPSCLVCSMCAEPFVSSWKALFHLMEHHRMKLFNPDYSKEALSKAAEQVARDGPAVEKRMKTWIDTHAAATAAAAAE